MSDILPAIFFGHGNPMNALSTWRIDLDAVRAGGGTRSMNVASVLVAARRWRRLEGLLARRRHFAWFQP
jgi:hypothetical protein